MGVMADMATLSGVTVNTKYLQDWNCPICNKQCPRKDIYVDSYMIYMLDSIPNDVSEVLLKADGTWSHEGNTNDNREIIDLTDPNLVIETIVKMEQDTEVLSG